MTDSLTYKLAQTFELVIPCCISSIRVLKLTKPQSKEARLSAWSFSILCALLPLRQTQEETTEPTEHGMTEQVKTSKFLNSLDNWLQFSERIVLIIGAIAPTVCQFTNIYIFVAVTIAILQITMVIYKYSGILCIKIARGVRILENLTDSLTYKLAQTFELVIPCCISSIRVLKLTKPQSKEARLSAWSFSILRARIDPRHVRCLYNLARVLTW